MPLDTKHSHIWHLALLPSPNKQRRPQVAQDEKEQPLCCKSPSYYLDLSQVHGQETGLPTHFHQGLEARNPARTNICGSVDLFLEPPCIERQPLPDLPIHASGLRFELGRVHMLVQCEALPRNNLKPFLTYPALLKPFPCCSTKP